MSLFNWLSLTEFQFKNTFLGNDEFSPSIFYLSNSKSQAAIEKLKNNKMAGDDQIKEAMLKKQLDCTIWKLLN